MLRPVIYHAGQIRPVVSGDFKRWLPLWEGYNQFYGRSGDTALSEELTRMTWERFLDPAEPMHALVAEEGDSLVGVGHYLFHRSTTLVTYNCYLQDLFTDPAARGRGIGKALILAVYDQAKKAGSTRVYWQTHETNLTAMKLYEQVAEKSGFLVYRKQL